MKTRTLRTNEDLAKAGKDMLLIPPESLPLVMTLSKGRQRRSEGANAHYWASLGDALNEINNAISDASEATGYTNLEVRRIIGREMEWERSMILAVRSSEAAHEVIKLIYGIPTSVKLGSKEFSRFFETMDQTLAEIVGEIKAIASRMQEDA